MSRSHATLFISAKVRHVVSLPAPANGKMAEGKWPVFLNLRRDFVLSRCIYMLLAALKCDIVARKEFYPFTTKSLQVDLNVVEADKVMR